MGTAKIPKLMKDSLHVGHNVDNSTSTIQKLYQLYCDPVLSDLQLIVGEHQFFAHKLILSISSDVFKTMLTSPTWPESQRDQIYLEEEPQCIAVFEDFLQYLYTGKIHLSHTTVLPVLVLADKYNIGDLSSVCIDFMCSSFVSKVKAESSVLSWLSYALMCNHKNLEKACREYITSNFQYVMESEEFLSVSSEMMLEFIKSSELVVSNELSLFQNVLLWIRRNFMPPNSMQSISSKDLSILKEIIAFIRFSLMSKDDISVLKLNTQKAIDFIQMSTGLNCMPVQGPNIDTKACHRNECSRIYTCDSWCTEVVIPNIDEVQPGEKLGAFFSTPCKNDGNNDENWDWHIDLYPRGVLFKGCMMIGHYENYSIDEVIYERVRLAVTSNTTDTRPVKVTVLVFGHEDGKEYVAKTLTKKCLFNSEHVIHHVNDLVGFSDLENQNSPYLIGNDHKTFKIKIIIRPIMSFVDD